MFLANFAYRYDLDLDDGILKTGQSEPLPSIRDPRQEPDLSFLSPVYDFVPGANPVPIEHGVSPPSTRESSPLVSESFLVSSLSTSVLVTDHISLDLLLPPFSMLYSRHIS